MEELKSLVARAQAGELDAFGQVVRRFQDMACGYAYSILGDFHLAEDVAQEAFIEAYRCLANLREPAAFPGWFRRIVFKHCDRFTRGRQVPTVPLDGAEVVASPDRQPAQAAEDREMKANVLAAIRSLPERERTVTTLFYINGYSQSDIAEFLEIPGGTVKSRLAASRNRLKKRMIEMVAEQLQASKPGPEFSARLFNGINLDRWVILSEPSHYRIDGDELVFENPGGKGPALHAEVGGMSWDDYRVGVDVCVERDSSAQAKYPFNVQLCPNGTCVYCQLFGGSMILAYWDNDREPHFTHLAAEERPIGIEKWRRFEVLVQNGGAMLYLDGEEVIARAVPRGTRGMLGLIVNFDSDARVRLRNIQITFLKPTPDQLRELESDAATNWADFKRREIEAGRRKSMEDNSL